MTTSKRDSSFRQTKITKTGDYTFNVGTAASGHFECVSKEKLSGLKATSHVKSEDAIFHGIGKKQPLVCDSCQKVVAKLQGKFDDEFQKILFLCPSCK